MKSQLLRRYGIAVVIAATMAATIALPAFAAFAWTMGSGPTISSVTGTTWTVTWTIASRRLACDMWGDDRPIDLYTHQCAEWQPASMGHLVLHGK